MSRHINPEHFINLPSGASVHPCRLIHKDGTLMWRHALAGSQVVPSELAIETNIIETALRIEELNSWASAFCEIWDCLMPIKWYEPADCHHNDGRRVLLDHTSMDNSDVFTLVSAHLKDGELLVFNDSDDLLLFCRGEFADQTI